MAEMWHPKPLEVYLDWVTALETEASDKLTNWESSFLANIRMRLDNMITLTQPQEEVLEKLYARYTK